MKITYPADRTVSVWIGNFATEEDFEDCVDSSVVPLLGLETDIISICEAGFERDAVAVKDLINGFSGWETFIDAALSAAAAQGIATANAALVCYYLECIDAPQVWGGLKFLGSFPGQDVIPDESNEE